VMMPLVAVSNAALRGLQPRIVENVSPLSSFSKSPPRGPPRQRRAATCRGGCSWHPSRIILRRTPPVFLDAIGPLRPPTRWPVCTAHHAGSSAGAHQDHSNLAASLDVLSIAAPPDPLGDLSTLSRRTDDSSDALRPQQSAFSCFPRIAMSCDHVGQGVGGGVGGGALSRLEPGSREASPPTQVRGRAASTSVPTRRQTRAILRPLAKVSSSYGRLCPQATLSAPTRVFLP